MERREMWLKRIYITLIGLVSAAILFGILFPIFAQAHESGHGTCSSNLFRLSHAMLEYSEDYDSHLPPASRWMDAVVETALPWQAQEVEGCFRCDVIRQGKGFGYAMLDSMSSRHLGEVQDPINELVLVESRDLRRNAHGGMELLPSPARHFRGNNATTLYGKRKFLK